ncbi:hypothetical protein JNB11_03435 [Kocuria palustris]|nr:hypothetical protein [Kocuria palustris]
MAVMKRCLVVQRFSLVVIWGIAQLKRSSFVGGVCGVTMQDWVPIKISQGKYVHMHWFIVQGIPTIENGEMGVAARD